MSDNEINDVDAELLAMAGDDDSDSGSESGDAPDNLNGNDDPLSPRSPTPEVKPTVEKTEEAVTARPRGVAQKVRKARGKKKVSKRELEDELLDLGDDSASESESIRADVISDEEQDAPGSPEDEGPLYPIEGRFKSEQDREDIMAMPEIERESELAERAAAVQKKQQDLQLKKVLASAKEQASKHKRKAAAADLDDGRKGSKKKSALDNYKKAREAKGSERVTRFDQTSGGTDERSPSSASDRDAEGESEVEWADSSTKKEPAADLKDFERCRIGRSNFARVWAYPGFETTITGCFARVSIGVDRETGQNLYRMAQITGFKDGKPYTLEKAPGKSFHIDQYAIVTQGASSKPWPFHACSDGKFTLEEYQRYHDTLTKEHIKAPKKSWLENKVKDINAFLGQQWNDTTLNQKMKTIEDMERKLDPRTALKTKRDAITKRRTEAEEAGDEEEIAKCEAELAAVANSEINGKAGGLGHTASPAGGLNKPVSAMNQQERLAALNAKNRGKTSDDVRKALHAERRAHQRAREEAWAKQKAEKEAAAAKAAEAVEHKISGEGLLGVPVKKGAMADLFGDTPEVSRAGTPVSGAGTPRRREGTPMGRVRGVVGGRKKVEEEVLDLGIDVEI